MRLEQSTSGPVWVFDKEECRDFAYICACMPSDRMDQRARDLINKLYVKWTSSRGYLTQGQWDWFAEIADQYKSFIVSQDDAVAEIRKAMRAL